jgi:hypothetical protein
VRRSSAVGFGYIKISEHQLLPLDPPSLLLLQDKWHAKTLIPSIIIIIIVCASEMATCIYHITRITQYITGVSHLLCQMSFSRDICVFPLCVRRLPPPFSEKSAHVLRRGNMMRGCLISAGAPCNTRFWLISLMWYGYSSKRTRKGGMQMLRAGRPHVMRFSV